MNYAEKVALIERADNRRKGISDGKGPEYAGQGKTYKTDEAADVLANFKRNAERAGVSPVTVLAVYMGKHLDSIDTFVREFTQAKSDMERHGLVVRGEGVISRLDDARNYMDLAECLLADLGYHPEVSE